MQRQLETRMRVVRTLERLMQSTPIDKIKVTDLCREADIGRATFYEYFENIYAVATWYYSHLLDQSLYLIGEGVDFQTAHVRLFESLLQDRSFFTRAFRSSDYNSVYNYGNRIIADHYLQIIPHISGKPLSPDEEMHVRLFTAGAAFLTTEWARNGMEMPPEDMARMCTGATPEVFACLVTPPSR